MAALQAIGFEEYCNCVLVRDAVRRAFLIQPPDYNEAKPTDPQTAAKLAAIAGAFPELQFTHIPWGTLVSREKFANVDSDKDLGVILGYPCAADYQYTLDNRNTVVTYGIGIQAFTRAKPRDPVQLLVNVCRDDSTLDVMGRLAVAAEAALRADPVIGPLLDRVESYIDENVPAAVILDKLGSGAAFSAGEESELRNFIFNLSLDRLVEYDYQFTNPVHRGILITLVSHYMHTPLSAFYPLQRYPRQMALVDIETAAWGRELVRMLDSTRAGRGGGKRKTRRR
jgi:hypothetical protein